MPGKPKLLDQAREKLRVKHYSLRTEQAYLDWIRRFILQHSLVLVGVGRKKVGSPRSQRAAESNHRMILFRAHSARYACFIFPQISRT
jgi:hypothetical protein